MSAEVFTTQEVAEQFAVSVKTVNRWRRAGRITGFPAFPRDGGPNSLAADRGWRFPAAEVDRLLAGLQAPTTQ
jgi:transposase InsO family protein